MPFDPISYNLARLATTATGLSQVRDRPLYNLRSGMLPRLTAALASTREGVSDTIIAFCGDSTMRGTSAGQGTAQFANGTPIKVSRLLRNIGYVTQHENVFGNLASGALSASDSRVTTTGTIGQSNNVPGGRFFVLSATGAKVTFTPRENVDTIDIYTVRNTGLGTMSLNIDGSGAISLDSNGAKAVIKTTFNVTLGAHAVNVSWVSGTNYLLAIDAYSTATKHVRCWNMGWPSSDSTSWIVNTNVWEPRLLLASTTMRPTAIIFDIGLNDMNVTTPDAAAYTGRMVSIINDWKVGSDVILKTWLPPSAPSWASQAVITAHLEALYSIALTCNVPLINTQFLASPDYSTNNTNGLMADNVHSTSAGYSVEARQISNFLAAL